MSRRAGKSVLSTFAMSVSVVLLACGTLGALAGQVAQGSELSAARERWASRTFTRYLLDVQEETPAGACRQELQIENEHIAQVVENHCVRIPSWTVTNLFTWAAGLNDHVARCYPTEAACVCHAIYTAQTSFDPRLGYPQRIAYRWVLRTNWAYPGHWERMLRTHELPDCQQTARHVEGFVDITVLSVTPLR